MKKSPNFMENRSSLPYLQKPAIGPCSELGKAIAHRPFFHNNIANKRTLRT
jgi:hypothetical protein